jgi:hypothetical protein
MGLAREIPWRPIKTTLLRDLEEVCDVTYREFENPEELRGDLHQFFRRVGEAAASKPILPTTGQVWPGGLEPANDDPLRSRDLSHSDQQSEQQRLTSHRIRASS